MTDTISLDPAVPADLDLVAPLVTAVNWPHRRADVQILMELGHGRVVRGDGGRFLGVGLWWSFGADAARLGLVIVAPEAQGRGIGRRLVETLLADAAGRSVTLIATTAGRPLYDRLGFVEIGSNCQHQGEYSGHPHADPRVRPATADDRGAILALDADAFGVERHRVIDRLAAAGRVFVATEAGSVTGYAIERESGRGSVVGPVVAASEADAAALFWAAARPGFTRVDRPSHAMSFGRVLTGSGLPQASESAVMLRGDWVVSRGPHLVYGLASHALG